MRALTLVTEAEDPVGDVATLLAELHRHGMDAGGSIFAAYCVGFADAEAAQVAANEAGRDGWDAAMFRVSSRHVVRLSREGEATAQRLEADREYVSCFADRQGGRWEGLALEELGPDDYWERIAERFVRKPLVESPTEPVTSVSVG